MDTPCLRLSQEDLDQVIKMLSPMPFGLAMPLWQFFQAKVQEQAYTGNHEAQGTVPFEAPVGDAKKA